jgi:hypothetical protein
MSLPPAEESHHGHGLAISKLLKAMQPSQLKPSAASRQKVTVYQSFHFLSNH